MEQLRKIFKRVAKAPEKIVFAIMVMVLIWRVVQIVMPRTDGPPKHELPIQAPKVEPGPLDPGPDEPVSTYAAIRVGKWDLYGSGPAASSDDDERKDADMPDIQLDRIEEKGSAVYAWVTVDGGTPKPLTKSKSFAKRQAILEEIDTEAGKIVFTWRPSNRKYERTTGG